MPKSIISVDLKKDPRKLDPLPHNRWHPDIPVVASVKPGDEFMVEALDWTGGQIKNDDNANDVRDCYLPRCHHLFGPIEVQGAEPGDILVVDILDIGAHRGNEWGYTGIFVRAMAAASSPICSRRLGRRSGISKGIYATSRHIPEGALRRDHPSRPDRLRARATSSWPGGTSARRSSSRPTRSASRRSRCHRWRPASCSAQ